MFVDDVVLVGESPEEVNEFGRVENSTGRKGTKDK